MTVDIKLPDLGDGIESGDVLNVLVKEGDTVGPDQGIVELETDKATVEVPASKAGKVTKVHVKSGQTVKVGQVLVSLEGETAAPAKPAAPSPKPAAATPPPQAAASPPSQPATRPTPPPTTPPRPAPAAPVAAAPSASSTAVEVAEPGETVPAGPAIRRFAREVGVDLQRVTGSGPGGRITREDIVRVVRESNKAVQASALLSGKATSGADAPGTRASDHYGPVRIEPMSKIRRTIAAKMHESWTTIPRVTNFDDADVTDLESIRRKSKEDYAESGIKLTTLPFIIKAVAMTLRANPVINASLDPEQDQIIYKDYVNIGVAVDTERGLVVPSLRNADQLSIPDIARNLATLAEKVRANTFTIDELRGSTFTISNLGAIGGTYSTPIINPPEVAILLVGRARKMPVVMGEDRIVSRLILPLSLSYDHRLVDGAAAARFLNGVIGYLEAPSRLLLAP